MYVHVCLYNNTYSILVVIADGRVFRVELRRSAGLAVMSESVRSRRRPVEGGLRGQSAADEGVKKRQGSPTPPFSRWILAWVAVFIAVVHLLSARLDSALPPPKLASSPPSLFSETRSREWLEELM